MMTRIRAASLCRFALDRYGPLPHPSVTLDTWTNKKKCLRRLVDLTDLPCERLYRGTHARRLKDRSTVKQRVNKILGVVDIQRAICLMIVDRNSTTGKMVSRFQNHRTESEKLAPKWGLKWRQHTLFAKGFNCVKSRWKPVLAFRPQQFSRAHFQSQPLGHLQDAKSNSPDME